MRAWSPIYGKLVALGQENDEILMAKPTDQSWIQVNNEYILYDRFFNNTHVPIGAFSVPMETLNILANACIPIHAKWTGGSGLDVFLQ